MNSISDNWRVIWTEKDNPKEYGWYLVSILEIHDLGMSRYTDILSWGHRAGLGDCWFIASNTQRVIAWQDRPKPYGDGENK